MKRPPQIPTGAVNSGGAEWTHALEVYRSATVCRAAVVVEVSGVVSPATEVVPENADQLPFDEDADRSRGAPVAFFAGLQPARLRSFAVRSL